MTGPKIQDPVYLIDGIRTPFIKSKGKRAQWSAADLGVYISRALFTKHHFDPKMVDQVIAACVNPSEDEANIARIIGLRAGCSLETPAYTVARNCGSGLQALDNACASLRLGQSEATLVVASEVMSRAPLIWSPEMSDWFSMGSAIKDPWKRIQWIFACPWKKISPIISLKQGLTDPTNALMMGQTAQEIAYRYHIDRTEMDEYAVNSHYKAHEAWEKGCMQEVYPLIFPNCTPVLRDDGIRPDATLEKLSQMKGVFDKKGSITAANSSQITDGAAAALLATKDFITKYQIQPKGVIRDIQWTGCNPRMMGLGPVKAMTQILQRNGLSFDDIGVIEINEAFAAQILGVIKSFNDPQLGELYTGIDSRYGDFPVDRLNLWGGAIALGHPIAASGLRVILRALYGLEQKQQRFALVSLCIGGGQGGAALIERLEKE